MAFRYLFARCLASFFDSSWLLRALARRFPLASSCFNFMILGVHHSFARLPGLDQGTARSMAFWMHWLIVSGAVNVVFLFSHVSGGRRRPFLCASNMSDFVLSCIRRGVYPGFWMWSVVTVMVWSDDPPDPGSHDQFRTMVAHVLLQR